MSSSSFPSPSLAIDCAGPYLSVALAHNNQIFSRHEVGRCLHSSLLLSFIMDLMQEANIFPTDFKSFIYTSGPGSFTGLKIGLSLLKGLALPTAIPLIAVPSLDHLAFSLPERDSTRLSIALIDAHMGDVFTAAYRYNPFEKVKKDTIISLASPDWEHYIAHYPDAQWIAQSPITGLEDQSLHYHTPKASDLFPLVDLMAYPLTTATEAKLTYLRDKIALTTQEQAQYHHASS